MANFFSEIISPHTLSNIKGLGDKYDTFNIGMKQLLNFQFMLFDCINDLASKFNSIQSDVNLLNSQLSNVDEAVQSYFKQNKISILTRDGVPLDDALQVMSDKIATIYHRLDSYDNRAEKLELITDDCVRKEDFRSIKIELNQNTKATNETSYGVQLLQKEIESQKTNLDDKWKLLKDLFKTEVDGVKSNIDSKMSKEDMKEYIKHTEIAELITFIDSLPKEKKVRIPNIIPQVFQDSATTMEEKLKKAYDLLSVERSRIDLEDVELIQEFSQLKNLAKAHFQDPSIEAKFRDIIVFDVATDSGYSERNNERHLTFNRGRPRSTIGTNFDPPDHIDACRETPFEQLIDELIESRRKEGPSQEINENELKEKMTTEIQKNVEIQVTALMKGLGMNIDQQDIHHLIDALKTVEEVKDDVNSLKIKLQLKMDQSKVLQELEKYLKREEFFDMLDTPASSSRNTKRPTSALPKVRSKQAIPASATSRKQKPEVKSPAMLVPARNSKLLGVNDKFLIGDDGKTYLKETTRVGDKNYKEPPITGTGSSRVSYYDRSKMSMEIDGVDAVVDFQPFVSVDELKKNQKAKDHDEYMPISDDE